MVGFVFLVIAAVVVILWGLGEIVSPRKMEVDSLIMATGGSPDQGSLAALDASIRCCGVGVCALGLTVLIILFKGGREGWVWWMILSDAILVLGGETIVMVKIKDKKNWPYLLGVLVFSLIGLALSRGQFY